MKILIADDHHVVREGLKQIVSKMKTLSVLDEAEDGQHALNKIEENEYDLVIMDISMPGKSGLDILQELRDKKLNVPVLILSVHAEEQYAIRAMKLGASGYISKGSIFKELESAINIILSGGRYLSPALAEKILFGRKDGLNRMPHEQLSQREFQIMCLLAKGLSVKNIADSLFISSKTVSTHRMRILQKMGMEKNADLTSYALKNNLIE